MKKRIVIAVLVLIFLSGFVSCGSNGDRKSSEMPGEGSGTSMSEGGGKDDAGAEGSAVSVVSEASESSGASIISLTIPEGFTLARIGMTLEEKGVCTTEDFIKAAQEGDFSEFPLVAAQVPNENRCFKLEGYLFPDTYQIYATDSPDKIIRKMLNNTETKITEEMRAQIAASGYSVDEILALASIIEKEALGHQHMNDISSVLHNRLDSKTRLECDVTKVYVEGAIKPFIDGDINRYSSFYNTYKCPAVPAGAIANPGIDAIKAALAPADTNYLFFVTDKDQKFYFAETWEGHKENLVLAGIEEESNAD